MARIAVLGPSLQNIYLIDHDDLASTNIGSTAILGKVLVGSEVEIDKINYNVSGNGLNSAVTFARHNHETILISNVGRDAASEAIISTLNRENIDSSFLEISQRENTGTSITLLDSKSGERTILTNTGASKKFENTQETDINLIDPDWLFITNTYGNIDLIERFAKEAKHNKTFVALKPGDIELEDPKRFLRLLKFLNVLILNKKQAEKLVPGTSLIELAEHLNGYTETVIITDGQMGGIAVNSKEAYRFGLYETTKVKDISGAGDAFASGFIAHIAAGKTFKSSIIFASANSASVISKVGTVSGILPEKVTLHDMPIQKI